MGSKERKFCIDGLKTKKNQLSATELVGFTSPIIIIIWSKMAKLGLEESSEVEGFRRPKYTQMKAEHSI